MIKPIGGSVEDFWTAIKNGSPLSIEMVFRSQNVTLTNSDININEGVTITDSFNSDTNLKIGKTVTRQFTAKILLDNIPAGFRWMDRFSLRFSTEINGGTTTVFVGYFNGQRPKNLYSSREIEYTAYDDSYKLDAETDDFFDDLTYPITAWDLHKAVCKYAGLDVGLPDTDYPSRDFWEEVYYTKNDLKDFKTLREILESIAEASCSYIKVDTDARCKFVWFGQEQADDPGWYPYLTIGQTEEYSLEYDVYGQAGYTWQELYDNSKWGELNYSTWLFLKGQVNRGIVDRVYVNYKGTKAKAGVSAKNALHNYEIIDNVFTRYDVDEVANFTYARMQALGKLLNLHVECVGNVCLEAGDLVDVKLSDSVTARIPIYYKVFHWNGNPVDSIEITEEL